MTQPLRDFIDQVRLAESIEDERYYISTEQAQIRASLRTMDPMLRPRIVSKLVFLDALGHNTAWGQMEALTLMRHDRFSFKRLGYICTATILDQTAELTVLVTQTLLSDLTDASPFIQRLALAFIANLASPEVCRVVATEVQKHLESQDPHVMKFAGMATTRVIRLVPDLSDSFKNSVQTLLNSPRHGVVISGINLVIAMIRAEPKLARSWSQFQIPFTKMLKALHTTRPSREFSWGLFNDPFLQVKALEALSLLKKENEELEGILQSIVSGTESRRNTGRSILYAAVDAILGTSKRASLRGLAFNQVGRLLSLKDPNVLYSALSSFARVLYNDQAILNRGSVDSMALQRYKAQIVACLDHPDSSIRRRALSVISALIDEHNVESLVPEIVSYLKLADGEFRSELVSQVYAASQRFAPNPVWNFDTVHALLVDSGDYVPMEIISSFCDTIGKTASIQAHAVQKLNESLVNFSENQSLVQVAAFVIGEFAMADPGAAATLSQILVMPQTRPETLLYIVTALSKLAVRFQTLPATVEVLRRLLGHNNLEVQQRTGEMMRLLGFAEMSVAFLAPIEVSQDSDHAASIQINQTAAAESAAGSATGDDILLLMLDDKGGNAPPSKPVSSANDLFAALGSSPTEQQSQAKAPSAPTPIELLSVSDFDIYGSAEPHPNDPRHIALRLFVCGTGGSPLTDFRIAFNPAPGWQIRPQPLEPAVIQARKQSPLPVLIYVTNLNNSPFHLQVKAAYKFGAQPLSATGTITKIPFLQ